MLKVVGFYRKDGALHGFKLEDEGTFNVAPMSLYIEQNIKDLVEAGYSFSDYNPENIKLPNGESIMSLPELELDSNVVVEINAAKRGLNQVLSDAQASRYYSTAMGPVTEVEFVKYPGPFLINTREELHEYVKRAEENLRRNPAKVEIRPMNTLVNPDIWFTPEEILTATDNLYYRVLGLRKWGNFEHVMRTAQFFIEQGLMTADDINIRSILRAWYAYGPDLIKGKYTDTRISLDVDGNFYQNDKLSSITVKGGTGTTELSICAVNRRPSLAAYNTRNGKIVAWTGEEVDADGILSLDRGQRYPLYLSDVNLNRLKMSTTDSEAIPTKCSVVDATDRFYCSIVSNGCTYRFKCDPYRIQLNYSNKDDFCCDSPMCVATLNPGSFIPLAEIKDYETYQKFLVAQMYTLYYTKNNTIEPISYSNSTYLNQLHFTPTGVIKKFASRKNPDNILHIEQKHWGNYKGIGEILALYAQPIPAYIAETLKTSDDITKHEFLQTADIDAYAAIIGDEDADAPKPASWISNKESLESATRKIMALEAQGITDDAYNYYYKIKLVEDALSGRSEYGCLEEGKSMDNEVKVLDGAKALMAVVNALFGTNCTVEQFSNALETLESRVDFKLLYRRREAAAVGYIRDFANDANLMCNRDTIAWCYCTKVFRELSNLPVNEQRPYLLEMLAFYKGNTVDNYIREAFMVIAETALEATPIVPDYNYNYAFGAEGDTISSREKLSKKFAGYFASRLLFNCLIGVKTGRIPTDTPYSETASIFEDSSVTFVVPTAILSAIQAVDLETHRKYIPVHTYCTYDVMENSEFGHSQFVCVNAEITPWSVKSLPGYQIKSYPFMYNYYDTATLANTFGNDRVNALVANKAKCLPSIQERTKGTWKKVRDQYSGLTTEEFFAPEASMQGNLSISENLVRTAQSVEDFDILLEDAYACESISAYVKRWTLEKKKAAAEGKTILSIPLKQDILYKEIGISLGFDIVSETRYAEDDSCKANFLAEDVLVLPTTHGTQFITDKSTTKLESINCGNIDEKLVKNFTIIASVESLPAIMYYGTIITEGGVANADWIKQNFIQLTEKKYVGHLQNGYYIYEEE